MKGSRTGVGAIIGGGESGDSCCRHFIQACETFGRKNTGAIVERVVEATGKSSQEIRNYMNAFWKK